MTPSSGRMYWWRFKSQQEWKFGYCTNVTPGMVRMGRWNGDTTGGSVVMVNDIDWKDYK